MKRTLQIFIVIAFLIKGIVSFGQDFHFSQFAANRQTLNPAMIGNFEEDIRFSTSYRDQWFSANSPYKVFYGGIEMNHSSKSDRVRNFGSYFGFVNDFSKVGAFQNTWLQLGGSVHFNLDPPKKQSLSFGLQTGMQFRKLNASNLIFDDQFNSNTNTFTGGPASAERFGQPSQTYFQISTGLAYQNQINASTFLSVDLGLLTLNRRQETFTTDGAFPKYKQKERVTLATTVKHRINEKFFIEPSAYFLRQSKTMDLIAGSWLGIQIRKGDENAFLFSPGLFYRLNDALIFGAKLEYKTLALGITYDATLSQAKQIHLGGDFAGLKSFAALEMSLSYRFSFRPTVFHKTSIPCRTF